MKKLSLLCIALSSLWACNTSTPSNAPDTSSTTVSPEPLVNFEGGCYTWIDADSIVSSRLVFNIVEGAQVTGYLDLIEGEHVTSGDFTATHTNNEIKGVWTIEDAATGKIRKQSIQFKLQDENVLQNTADLDENGKFMDGSSPQYTRKFIPGPCNAKAE